MGLISSKASLRLIAAEMVNWGDRDEINFVALFCPRIQEIITIIISPTQKLNIIFFVSFIH